MKTAVDLAQDILDLPHGTYLADNWLVHTIVKTLCWWIIAREDYDERLVLWKKTQDEIIGIRLANERLTKMKMPIASCMSHGEAGTCDVILKGQPIFTSSIPDAHEIMRKINKALSEPKRAVIHTGHLYVDGLVIPSVVDPELQAFLADKINREPTDG